MVRRALIAWVMLLAGPALACPGQEAARFPEPVTVGTLIGLAVQQPIESQPLLGRVQAVAREPDGCLVVVMSYGGWLASFGGVWGLGSRPIAVPLGTMTLLGRAMEIADLTPEALKALPTYAGGAVALDAAETVRVGLSRPPH